VQHRIYKIGAPAQHAYVLLAGSVRVTTVDEDHQEVVVNAPAPGEFFGFASMLEQTPPQTEATEDHRGVTIFGGHVVDDAPCYRDRPVRVSPHGPRLSLGPTGTLLIGRPRGEPALPGHRSAQRRTGLREPRPARRSPQLQSSVTCPCRPLS
jgi:hypothetical protein